MNRIVHVSLIVLGSFLGLWLGAATDESVNNGSAHARGHEDMTDQRGLDDLASEVARLRRLVGELEEGARGRGSDDQDEPDMVALGVRERELSKQRAATLAATAEREAVDPSWGPITERKIAKRFTNRAPAGTKLLSVVCKTTLCVAEIQHSRPRSGNTSLDWRAILGLSRGLIVHGEPTASGRRHSVAYLARDGHRLPISSGRDSATEPGLHAAEAVDKIYAPQSCMPIDPDVGGIGDADIRFDAVEQVTLPDYQTFICPLVRSDVSGRLDDVWVRVNNANSYEDTPPRCCVHSVPLGAGFEDFECRTAPDTETRTSLHFAPDDFSEFDHGHYVVTCELGSEDGIINIRTRESP